MADSRLGILGAGRVGRAIKVLAEQAGMRVEIAASHDPIGAVVAADAVVLAIPLSKFRTLPANKLAGALVIDAMNYWWELDGHRPEFEDPLTSTSETVQTFLSGARVVKSLNHLSGYALEELARAPGAEDRVAAAVAGDVDADVDAVCAIVDRLGFDPVRAGRLADGTRFEPHTELFGADADAPEARAMLARFWDTQRGRVVARARGLSRS